MRKEELRTYIENHESEMIEDLKSLIRIPSEKQAAEPGKPFGAPAAEAKYAAFQPLFIFS